MPSETTPGSAVGQCSVRGEEGFECGDGGPDGGIRNDRCGHYLDGRSGGATEEALVRRPQRKPDRSRNRRRDAQCGDRQGPPARPIGPRQDEGGELRVPEGHPVAEALRRRSPATRTAQHGDARARQRRSPSTPRRERPSPTTWRSPCRSASPSWICASPCAAGPWATRPSRNSDSAARVRSPVCPIATTTPASRTSRSRTASGIAGSLALEDAPRRRRRRRAWSWPVKRVRFTFDAAARRIDGLIRVARRPFRPGRTSRRRNSPPRTVRMGSGLRGRLIAFRKRPTCTSTVRSSI